MKAVSPVIPGQEQNEIKIAENQPQYETLPALLVGGTKDERVYVDSLDQAEYFISRFELTDEEVAAIVKTRSLLFFQYNFGQLVQPFLIEARLPEA